MKLSGDDVRSNENVKEEGEIAGCDLVDDRRKELCAAEKSLNSFLNLLDANLKVLDEANRHHKEMSMKLSNVHFGENVKIDIGGRIFRTSLKTLRRESESFLALMFSEKFDLKKEDDGSFFIDRDGTFFHHVLNYLRDGYLSEDVIEAYGPQMQNEAEFYGLLGLKEQIYNYNHVKLNVGGREFVVNRAVLKKYSESMFGRMLAGEECAFERSQDGSYCIDRDGANFNHIYQYLGSGIISDDVIKERGVSFLYDAIFYVLPDLEERIHNYYRVKINVGGTEFVIKREVFFNRWSCPFFKKMLAGEEGDYVKRDDGSYYIERDASVFTYIAQYLQNPSENVKVSAEEMRVKVRDEFFRFGFCPAPSISHDYYLN